MKLNLVFLLIVFTLVNSQCTNFQSCEECTVNSCSKFFKKKTNFKDWCSMENKCSNNDCIPYNILFIADEVSHYRYNLTFPLSCPTTIRQTTECTPFSGN